MIRMGGRNGARFMVVSCTSGRVLHTGPFKVCAAWCLRSQTVPTYGPVRLVRRGAMSDDVSSFVPMTFG